MTWKYFTPAEFACRCCGEPHMNDEFVETLDRMRDAVGFPFIVVSGYRCPRHNRAVSTTGLTGPHTTGHAVDLSVSRAQALRLVSIAASYGITGIGVHQRGNSRFIHLDDLPNAPGQPRPTIWSY